MLWSYEALSLKWQKAEYMYARHIELYRHFNHRVIHVFVHDLNDVNDDDVKSILDSGEYIQWNSNQTNLVKSVTFDKLLSKIYQFH